ncbi:hypothetical protein TU94_32100 [Streptomyces cyaneogriseus subsp. noncyanogenus]|uniref:Uncharacterized protein n=1 Tax=Streptomyces cyaneogriseus subsp. noncyanogenus TaxID=477245 RepID=A0A0C5GAM3_9ACTN|nr:hypothetical protein [Streptomyces cyaneogriseus]AJP05369.1 hypothetical protein TU94_32100 [Streptomyces cyaneogriseus subsp. noncyanogenus]
MHGHDIAADIVDGPAQRARAAAAGVWARVRPVVDVALAAVDVVAVVYVMRGVSMHHRLDDDRRPARPPPAR